MGTAVPALFFHSYKDACRLAFFVSIWVDEILLKRNQGILQSRISDRQNLNSEQSCISGSPHSNCHRRDGHIARHLNRGQQRIKAAEFGSRHRQTNDGSVVCAATTPAK